MLSRGLGVAVDVERQRKSGGWEVRKVDSFGNTVDVPYFSKFKNQAMLVESEMRHELNNDRKLTSR